MKKSKYLFFLGLSFLLSVQPLFAQSKQEKKEQKQKEVKEQLDSGRFTIEVDRALPMAGKMVNLTSSYSLEMHGDSVISHLPYFGRAYSVPYGGSGGVQFSEKVTDYKLEYDDKGDARITFEVRPKDDQYKFDVRVFTNGSATINVQPVNKQSISYQGELKPKTMIALKDGVLP